MQRYLTMAGLVTLAATGLPGPSQAQNFGGFPVTLTGPAAVSGNTLRLFNDQYGASSSAFTTAAYLLNQATSWNASFDFLLQLTTFNPQADGFAFVLQSNSPTTVGGGGGGIGYSGLANSAAVTFQTWDNNAIGTGNNGSITWQKTDFGITDDPSSGAFNSGCKLTSCFFAQLLRGSVQLSYDPVGQVIRTIITGGLATFFDGSANVDVPFAYDFTTSFTEMANVGTAGTYFGFTAGTGLSTQLAEVSNFSMTVDGRTPVSVSPEPASLALLATGLVGLAGLVGRRATNR